MMGRWRISTIENSFKLFNAFCLLQHYSLFQTFFLLVKILFLQLLGLINSFVGVFHDALDAGVCHMMKLLHLLTQLPLIQLILV